MDRGVAVLATVFAGSWCAAGADQFHAGEIGRKPAGGFGLVRGRARGADRHHAPGRRRVRRCRGGPKLSWYYLTGGVLGAVYVTTALVAVRTLGAGGVTAATIAGQLTLSVTLDRLGVLGLEERALTSSRLLGVALLAAGTFLVVR